MTSMANRGRMRVPNTVVKNPNTFTFRKNLTTPQMQRRFIGPQPVLVENYSVAREMQTQNLNNINMSRPYEVVTVPYEEDYLSAVDTDVMLPEDQDIWDADAFTEPENIVIIKEGNPLKRKNTFSYHANASQSSEPNMSAYKENKIMYGQTVKVKQNSMKNVNDSVKSTPMRQTVLCTDSTNALGIKLNQKEKSVADILKNSPKAYPRWSPAQSPQKFKHKSEKNETFPRIFTVTVEKLQTWPKSLSCTEQIFELFAILEKILDIEKPKSKKMQLRSQNAKNRLICTFHEIDRPLPKLRLGQWQRCILLLRRRGEYQCLTIRSAAADELMQLDKWVTDSSKSMAMLLKLRNDN